MALSLDSLRCFEAAASCLSFGTAARRVALSATAFSERIKRLEESYGHKLFERNTRRVVLTKRGLQLLPHARQLLIDARRCEELFAEAQTAAPVTLVIGTRFELGLSWIVPELSALNKAAPHRKIQLVFGDGPELLNKIKTGRIDAMVSSLRLTSAGLSYVSLHEEEYAFVTAPNGRKLSGPADSGRHVLLDIHGDLPLFRYFADAYAGEKLWSFADVECLGTIAAVRYRVLEGAGVAVLPRYFIAPDLKQKRLVTLFPKIKLRTDHFRLVWREGHPLQDEISTFAAHMSRVSLR